MDVAKIGTGIIDYARPDARSPYETHSLIVNTLRAYGYCSEPLENLILAYLEKLDSIRELKSELRDLGITEQALAVKSLGELATLLAEKSQAQGAQ